MTFKSLFGLTLAATCAFAALSETPEELLEEGRRAFMDYDFEKASKLYSQAKKASQTGDEDFNDKYNTYARQLNSANNYIGRVEKIIIIDSISLPKSEFFKYYKLPVSSGTLGDGSMLPAGVDADADYVFTNESEDFKLWAEQDSTGYYRIMETSRLTDGSWSTPGVIDEDLAYGSDAIYPFMMSDGVTLYYASDGDASMGGYDIMIAKRDATDGTFLQPSNIGFPYNSPYDDYMMAIDEFNGVGWWATDRKQLDDELTVYVFVVNDIRQNYPEDEDDIVAKARIDDYMATQPEDEDFEELLGTIDQIDPSERTRKHDFTLHTSGKIYHFYEDLPNNAAVEAMKKYLWAAEELEKNENSLMEARKEYHEGESDTLANEISVAERNIEKQREQVRKLLSEVYRAF